MLCCCHSDEPAGTGTTVAVVELARCEGRLIGECGAAEAKAATRC